MLRNPWSRLAAISLLAIIAPVAQVHASEPPSAKVARWHDRFCPRDLTPTVTSPLYGYYPTRWRLMPPDILLEELPPPEKTPKKVSPVPLTKTSLPRVRDEAPSRSPYGSPSEPANMRRDVEVRDER